MRRVSCGGGRPGVPSGFGGTGVEKLFITRSGGVVNSFPGDLGLRRALRTSLQSEYSLMRKWRVGPRGQRAIRRLVEPLSEREKRRSCVTPKGPAIVT